MKQLLILLIIAFSVQTLGAQSNSLNKFSKMVITGKRQNGQNTLRWAPADYVSWQEYARTGVMLERFTLVNGQIAPSSRKMLTTIPFKPSPLEQWKIQFAPQDTAAGAAAQALFGKTFPVTQGNPFEAIVSLEMQQGMLFGVGMLMADWRQDLADAMALRLEDKSIEANQSYLYRIFTAEPGNVNSDTAFCFVFPGEKWRAPEVTDLKVQELEKQVQLSWTFDGNLYAPSGYFIERSADDGKTFIRLNRQPFIKITTQDSPESEENRIVFTDSLGVNYHPFQYRVLAFNAFGEMGKGGKIIKAMGRDRTPPPPPLILKPEFIQGQGLIIKWTQAEPEDISGFYIAHSNKADGPFMPLHNGILPANTRSFLDPAAQARGLVNYYVVTAVDTAKNAMSSLPHHQYFNDSIPPVKPHGLKAVIDSTGRLIITWTPNTEPDLMGYNVFFANASYHEFIQLNGEPLKTDTFIQKLNLKTLSEEIFYKITALDESFNPSDFSEVLRVKKPDILPPVAPLIQEMGATTHSITLTWSPSPSRDAVETFLFRRKNSSENWQKIASVNQGIAFFEDSTVQVGQLYEYCLRAIDDDGLSSEYSEAHTGRAYPDAKGPGLRNFQAKQENDQLVSLLSWEYSSGEKSRIYIYRAYNDGPLQLYATVPADQKSYADRAITGGRKYQYAAKVVYNTGAESTMSMPQIVAFK